MIETICLKLICRLLMKVTEHSATLNQKSGKIDTAFALALTDPLFNWDAMLLVQASTSKN